MKVLVTGCLGFIGSNLCSHLLNAGYDVLGFDNMANPSLNPTDRIKQKSGANWSNFKFYQVDIRDLNSMHSICVNERPDMVVHLAALGSVPRSFKDPALVCEVNEKGFINVMSLATMLNCERVVFASSSSVYGNLAGGLRVEHMLGKPLSPYALTKIQNEKFAEIWCRNIALKYIGLRFFNVYGDGQLPDSAYSAVIPKWINGKEITVFGDGETIRDFTYVDDVCEAIELSLTSQKTNIICNVGTGNQTSLKELANEINNLSKVKKEIKFIDERPLDIKLSYAQTDKAEIDLKFKAVTDLKSGLAKTISYYESLKGIHSL